MKTPMRTVIIDVAPLDEVKRQSARRLSEAVKGRRQPPRITFVSHELLWKVLTPRRWALLKVMVGAGPLGVREIARRTERDVKGVHGDLQALRMAGVVGKTKDGRKYEFPYDAIHVDFMLKAA